MAAVPLEVADVGLDVAHDLLGRHVQEAHAAHDLARQLEALVAAVLDPRAHRLEHVQLAADLPRGDTRQAR